MEEDRGSGDSVATRFVFAATLAVFGGIILLDGLAIIGIGMMFRPGWVVAAAGGVFLLAAFLVTLPGDPAVGRLRFIAVFALLLLMAGIFAQHLFDFGSLLCMTDGDAACAPDWQARIVAGLALLLILFAAILAFREILARSRRADPDR